MTKHMRSVMLVVGLLWGLALLPAACSMPTPSETLSETSKESPQETSPETASVEKPQDASPSEPTPETKSEPTPELQPEPKPEPVVEASVEELIQEPSTPDALVQEIMPDSMFPKPGFGTLMGDCDVLDQSEWSSSQSYMFRNTIDFGTMSFDDKKLTPGGQQIWKDGNLGGSSVHSEIFAYEVLSRCESATLLKSEAKILYKDSSGKKTDILVTIDAHKIGVSVTRAFHFPPTNPFTEGEATTLLTKKLSDIPLSAKNADAKDAWVRSILHILAYNKQYADTVEAAYKKLDSKIKSDIILMVTTTDGKDDYVY